MEEHICQQKMMATGIIFFIGGIWVGKFFNKNHILNKNYMGPIL